MIYVYGIIKSERKKDFGCVGFEQGCAGKGRVYSLPIGHDVAMVVGESPLSDFSHRSQEELVRFLLSYQQTLETVMKEVFVLPCKFGTILADEAEGRDIISPNAALLRTWIDKIEDCSEMDVLVTWEPEVVLRELAQKDGEIAQWQKSLQSDKLALGMRLASKLREEADRYAGKITAHLGKISRSSAIHDVRNDGMVLNASFLVDRGGAFFEALGALDDQFLGKLQFKCIGPLPPYSFATVTIRRFDAQSIAHARAALELNGEGGLEDIKRCYRERARHCHPDARSGSDGREFETLRHAYELLSDYYEGGGQPVRVDVVTQGQS